jgi:hypothetical protein
LETDRSSLRGCPLCGGPRNPVSKAVRKRLVPSKRIFIHAETQFFDCSNDPSDRRAPCIEHELRPLCIFCVQRFPVCAFCMHWIGKRGWSSRHPASRGKCRKNAPPWPEAQAFQKCGEFDAILTHTFTLKQLEELHEHGPAAIKAEWFEEQSP